MESGLGWNLLCPHCPRCLKQACWVQGLVDTTKARDGQQRVPLMAGIGNAIFVNDISQAEIMSAACALHAIAQQADRIHSNVVPVRPVAPALQLVS